MDGLVSVLHELSPIDSRKRWRAIEIHICRTSERSDPTPNVDFLDDHVSMAPLHGEAFTIDAADVHTYLVNFVAGNEMAEAKIQAYEAQNNGRLDYVALKEHHEGVGVHALDITKAENVLATLYYGGEKKPTCGGKNLKNKSRQHSLLITREKGELSTLRR
jgi:hypothetical protein